MPAAAEMPIQPACMLNAMEIGRAAPEDNNVSTQYRQVGKRSADVGIQRFISIPGVWVCSCV